MNTSRRNLHIKFNIKAGGEVKRRMEKFKPFFGLYILIMSNIPVLLLMVSSLEANPNYKTFASLWFFWFLYCLFSKTDDDISTTAFFTKFPVYLPAYIVGYVHVFFLKLKYPNSDDPDEIVRFERRKKLKTIL